MSPLMIDFAVDWVVEEPVSVWGPVDESYQADHGYGTPHTDTVQDTQHIRRTVVICGVGQEPEEPSR